MLLAERSAVTGGRIIDLQIVATMQANGVNRIYTCNSSDFEEFSGIGVPAARASEKTKSGQVLGHSRKPPKIFRGGLHDRVYTEGRRSYAGRS
jgi:hypothetical protein